MVERHHGGIGLLEELWHPGQLAKDVAGESLVGGMLLERVGSAALFYLPAAAPAFPAWVASCVRLQARSGGEAISVCFVFFSFLAGRRPLDGALPSQ